MKESTTVFEKIPQLATKDTIHRTTSKDDKNTKHC